MLIKPFVTNVNSSGQALLTIGHSLSNLTWKIYQIGFALGIQAPAPQIAAHINGTPLTASTALNPSVFAQIQGAAPYAMETFFVGPPYPVLSSGDLIVVALVGAIPGDQFTASAIIEEASARANLQMGQLCIRMPTRR